MSRVVDETVFQEGLEFRGAHARCLSGELIVPNFPMSRIGRVTDFRYADGDAVDDLVIPGYAIDAGNILYRFIDFLWHCADADRRFRLAQFLESQISRILADEVNGRAAEAGIAGQV